MSNSTPAGPSQTVVVTPQRARAIELVPLIALIVTLATIIAGGGAMYRQVENDSVRITVVEQRLESRDAKATEMIERMARIETKLDLLTERRVRAD